MGDDRATVVRQAHVHAERQRAMPDGPILTAKMSTVHGVAAREHASEASPRVRGRHHGRGADRSNANHT
jgi:hypothetical protein